MVKGVNYPSFRQVVNRNFYAQNSLPPAGQNAYNQSMRISLAQKGFTFIEIVAAIAILAVGILAILTLFPVGIESSKKAAVRTKAALLGEMKMEELRTTKAFDNISSEGTEDAPQNFTTTEDPEQNYLFCITVSQAPKAYAPGETDPNLKKAVVTVFWPAKETVKLKRQRMDFTTYVGNR